MAHVPFVRSYTTVSFSGLFLFVAAPIIQYIGCEFEAAWALPGGIAILGSEATKHLCFGQEKNQDASLPAVAQNDLMGKVSEVYWIPIKKEMLINVGLC
jgi:hypothetical protein